ncbi:MAG: hypothetical protein IT323_00800 [Anaerolineae bacterium]|nr:hypothetical protein [Anaerolineae bacterium]
MFLDWLAREGGAVLSWWALAALMGIAIFPLLFRLMARLPSRGYPLARSAGLLLTGFLFWLFNNYGLLRNDTGGALVSWLLVLGLSGVLFATWPNREPILPWLRANMRLVLATEALFAALFVGWCIVRALNPDLTGTEKPMEMAFLSATRRSAVFPPHDPWFSGYAISYYHFGYVLMAMLANMSGVGNGVAFNLALPMLFALSGAGAFGVAYDLVAMRLTARTDEHKPHRRGPALLAGLAAAVFLVIMGNLGTVLVEIPYQTNTASPQYLAWMNLEERDALNAGCAPSGSLDPTSWCFWWWFRYSRVVRDLELGGQPVGAQPITEFPQFSYVLSDMHPHVLSMPWAVLSVGLGLTLVVKRRPAKLWEMLLYAIFVGGMVFLNSWDAVYIVFLVGADALRRLLGNGDGRLRASDLWGIAGFAATLGVLTFALYLPFFAGFRSQAGGIIPNFIWQTQFQQFFLMFGPFLVILGVFLFAEYRRAGPSFNARLALRAILTGAGLLVLALVILAVLAWAREGEGRYAVFRVMDESGGLLGLIPALLQRRLHGIVTQGALILAIFAVVARLFYRRPGDAPGQDDTQMAPYSPSAAFVLLCIAAGAVLTLVPDFAYLRDGFGVRINTVFKLYYQGWLLWAIASGYGLWSIFREDARREAAREETGRKRKSKVVGQVYRPPLPGPARAIVGVVIAVLITMGMVYPVFAIASRALKEGGHLGGLAQTMTLDGAPSLAQGLDDYAAITCLAQTATRDSDVVAEATRRGLAYNAAYGRVSALTGIPTLLGWDNHENQWRGPTFAELNNLTYVVEQTGEQRLETRYDAIANLYNTLDVAEARAIVARYGITYIYIGPTERRDFDAAGLAKFERLTPVCQSGSAAVYRASDLAAIGQTASAESEQSEP